MLQKDHLISIETSAIQHGISGGRASQALDEMEAEAAAGILGHLETGRSGGSGRMWRKPGRKRGENVEHIRLSSCEVHAKFMRSS